MREGPPAALFLCPGGVGVVALFARMRDNYGMGQSEGGRARVTHFARPRPIDGKTPTRGEQVCSTCGRPIKRVGRQMSTDGVRGQWKHA